MMRRAGDLRISLACGAADVVYFPLRMKRFDKIAGAVKPWRLCVLAAASAAAFCAFGALPAPYQAVEWIESHGGEGIDAGFSPAKGGGTAMDIEFVLMGNRNNTAITSCGYYDFGHYLCILQSIKQVGPTSIP